jgi:hypothetical protein
MLYQGKLKRTRHDASAGGTENPEEPRLTVEKTTTVLTPGGHAGGVAMLRLDGLRESIVAESGALVLVAEGADFYALLEVLPALHAELSLRAYTTRAPLDAMLNLPKAFAPFKEHQAEEFASESSEFWSESSEFNAAARAAEPQSKDKLSSWADRLLQAYVVDGAEKQINIPFPVQKSLIAAAADKEIEYSSLFDSARKEVFDLMKRDTLPRFVHSERFEALLNSIGEARPIPEAEPHFDLSAAKAVFASTGDGKGGDDGDPACYSPNYSGASHSKQ